HDTMFYNVMRSAMAQGHYVEDVFGDQAGFYKHALLKCIRFMDAIFCVGDYVQKEFRFLGPDFIHIDSQLAYNGVPCWKIGADEIRKMEQWHKWPVAHREGLPDLSGGEAAYYQGVQEFNACSRNIKVVFVNQFGWEQKLCGLRMPADMEFMDIRKGSDVEFGQSIYEPFGIAQVEPISFGGICVFSECCGCAGFVNLAAGGKPNPNFIVADYTELPTAG